MIATARIEAEKVRSNRVSDQYRFVFRSDADRVIAA
jgi:hypothetical protein